MCHRGLNDFFSTVYRTIEKNYGEHNADDIMTDEYYPLHKEIEKWLFKHMNWAIESNIAKTNIIMI